MSDLTAELDRWDELTPAERNALVAVHVMGWKSCGGEITGVECHWDTGIQKLPGKYIAKIRWNPTTDRNDCVEAVRVFCEKYGKFDCNGEMSDEMYPAGMRMIHSKPVGDLQEEAFYANGTLNGPCLIYHFLPYVFLLDPADVCKAILEALAESEDGA